MITKLNDQDLVRGVKAKVKQEKIIVAEVLAYLEEIDRRKLYVDYGVHTLFKFCTRILKYSDSEAAIRVKTVRVSKSVPLLKEKIKTGAINLTVAANLDTFFRNNQIADQSRVVKKLAFKSSKESQLILDSLATKPPPKTDVSTKVLNLFILHHRNTKILLQF